MSAMSDRRGVFAVTDLQAPAIIFSAQRHGPSAIADDFDTLFDSSPCGRV